MNEYRGNGPGIQSPPRLLVDHMSLLFIFPVAPGLLADWWCVAIPPLAGRDDSLEQLDSFQTNTKGYVPS